MKIYDVTLEIKEEMIVYPNNPSPSFSFYGKIPEQRTNGTLMSLGVHTGTHVDAELHIKTNGKGATSLPLESFYGPCRVLDLSKVGKEIHKEHLEKFNIKKNEIILLKTENSLKGYNQFRADFAHVKLDAAKYLVSKKVKTLGFDYLSVKKKGGDENVHELLIKNLTLFEGLDLSKIKEFTVAEKGMGQLNLSTLNLTDGMYSYSLVLNGKIIDTKKMLKTK